ncbi:MAG: hypothetical protein M3498_04565 [Deinococcota bacterium]|jgi:tetratricopeptide (TPR) repeat protein|nr:hypothetical protein [Deinococcota bacterium]
MPRLSDFSDERDLFYDAHRQALQAHAEGQAERADEAANRALALADAMPYEPELQSAAADLLLELGRLAEAALYLEAHLARLPGDAAGLRTTLGTTYLRLGRLKEAVSLLQASDAKVCLRSLLVLGSALRYRGHLEEARAPLTAAFRMAETGRELEAAVAALCALGELELDADNPKEAVIHFGKAFGLTEYSRSEKLSVLPLAGLAQAQGVWGYPAKGREVAGKALRRAQRQGERIGLARALLSLGLLSKETVHLHRAIAEADAAPHLPLALKAVVALAELEPGAVKLAAAMRLARGLGMDLDMHRLEAAATA